MHRKDGGTAFPTPVVPNPEGKGMSLRDWFAGQIIGGRAWADIEGLSYEELSEQAYRWADAMLAVRENRTDLFTRALSAAKEAAGELEALSTAYGEMRGTADILQMVKAEIAELEGE